MDPSKHAPLKIIDIRSKYKVIDKVGKGTYGTVFKVLNLQDKKYYAIKKFQNTEAKLQVEGFPITALREISLLKQLNHPNIINLIEIICSKPNKRNLFRGSTFMVFQYMHHDFSGLFRAKIKFSLSQIKCMMKQILEGCNYLHQNKIMHRDIKSANILLNDEGLVQLADFGLGRRTRFDNVYTYKVVTLWYRAPQLLLGCKTYNHKVDVWSIGCVLAQFLINQVLFKKETQYALLERIYQLCGGLQQNQFTEDYLRACVYIHQMRPKKPYKNTLQSYIKKMNPNVDQITLKFLKGLLQLNPYKRLSCQQALQHDFLKEYPLPCKPNQIHQLDVQYHQMFRDRSLKIQRKKEARKQSLDWSEQEEKKKNQKRQTKKVEEFSAPVHTHSKSFNDKGMNNYVSSQYKYQNGNRHYQNRFQDRKFQVNPRKQYVSHNNSRYHEHSEEKPYKNKKKYSKDRSYSSSSSSNSHSRSRNKKRNYEDKDYKDQKYSSSYRHDRDKQHSRKPNERNERDRYEQKERHYSSSYKKEYQSSSTYYKQKGIHKQRQRQKQYQRDDDKYEKKDYKPYKYGSREQNDKLIIKTQQRSSYQEDHNKVKIYPSYKNQRYSQKQKQLQRQKQKQKQRYNDRPYQSRLQSKDYQSRENKDYQYRENKDKEYFRKQYYTTQKYQDDRKHEKSKQRQYRDYEKKDYRSKDYNYRKISNQHRSPQRKRFSPYKKNMDIQEY